MLSDLEITKLCAEAMGGIGIPSPDGLLRLVPSHTSPLANIYAFPVYDPLHDDAQAMALVKKFELLIGKRDPAFTFGEDRWGVRGPNASAAMDADLNRAICLTVAKLHQAKREAA